jgi:multisubunit Na+/H+ antiporter MnhB subunit
MDAPTPASAYLHSATMVKAGVYLLARLHPTLGGGDFWSDALMTVGVATLFYSSVLALRQSDLKALLAFTTTAKLGALVALLGVPNGYGVKAALLGIIAHALYKSALFLSVGTIDHSTGTRQVKELGGLRQVLPITGLVVLISALSMAGFPPLLGFVAKETLLEAFMKYPVHLVLVFVSAVLTAAAAYILILDLFWGPVKGADHFHAPHRALELAPLLLACLTAGLAWWLDPLIKPLITPLIPVKFKLVLFPGFNDVFLLSMAAIALGGVAFYLRGAWRAVPEMSANALSLYDKLIGGAEWVADQVLKTQNGKLRHYLMVILGVAMSILLYGGLAEDLRNLDLRLGSFTLPDLLKIMLLILALGAAWFSIRARSHLNAALALGILGYALGGVFLVEPAPDVALVQFLVETLATVVLVIMISRVNPQHRRAAIEVLKRPTDNLGDLLARGRDVLIAVITGLCMFTFSYVAMENRDNRDSIAAWHMENATPEVGATDVVAAIVTDFRGTDTLVEISVFAISALGLLTLLTLNRGPDPKLDTLEMPIVRSYTATPMTRTVVGFILPLVMLILAAHTLYGGIAPGDGFTAGIVGGLGVALFYTVFGYKEAREYLKRLNPAQIIAGGLTLAFANALLPLVLGDNFMGWTDFIPGFGPADLKFSSTLVFEIAIGITVFGSASLMMEAVAHPVEVPDLRRSQQLAALRLDKED